MKIENSIAVVTGAASGIGRAICSELARQGCTAIAMVDMSDTVHAAASETNRAADRPVGDAFVGDVTNEGFRAQVFQTMRAEHGVVSICVPAAGFTRDALGVKVDKQTGKARIYPVETFRQVTEADLIAPIYWALEMVAGIAEDRHARGLGRWQPDEGLQGAVILIGSVSSLGNKGQIAYAAAKAGLEGAAASITMEAIYYGIRAAVIHPGYTDTPMVRALGDALIQERILPYTQLGRLIRPEEIAEAVCFLIRNPVVGGQLWVDAGWHPPAV